MTPQSDSPLWHLFDNLGRVEDHPTYGQSPSFSKQDFGVLTAFMPIFRGHVGL